MHRSIRSTAVVALIVFSGQALAEDARLQGTFVNAVSSDKPIRDAIDRSVASFNFVARPVARSRLKKSNPMIKRAEFGQNGSQITVKLGVQNPVSAVPGGAPVKWTRDDGEVLDVALAWEGATLVQSFKAADGMRYNRYVLSADGRSLTIQVTVTSPMLDTPVEYGLTMTRDPSE